MIRAILLAAALGVGAIPNAFAHGGGGGGVYTAYAMPEILPAAKTGDYSAIHTVAVISAIGQTLTIEKAGLLIPEKKSLDIRSWNIDGQVEAAIKRDLGERFAVRDIAPDRGALASIPNSVWDYSTPALRRVLGSLPRDGIDAFVVVRPDLESYTPGLPGLALALNTNMLMQNLLPVAWANYEIDVVDARTLGVVAKAYSRIRLRSGEQPSFSGLVCSDAVRPPDSLVPTDKQFALLHRLYSSLLDVSVLETVRALNISPDLPPVGARSLVAIPADKDPFAQIKSVAVISALGDELDFDHLGGTVFSQSHEVLPVPTWSLDDRIEDVARNVLSRRFTIKTVSADRHALVGASLLNSDGKLAPEFPGLSATSEVDAYVLVLRLKLKRWNTDEGGLGVWNHTPILETPNSNAVFANYAVAVVDAHTLKLMAAHSGAVGPDYPTPDVLREIDPASWPEHVAAATPQQLETIHRGLLKLIDDSVPETLLRTGLTGMMISTSPSGAVAAAR